jgi:hypothetical protein
MSIDSSSNVLLNFSSFVATRQLPTAEPFGVAQRAGCARNDHFGRRSHCRDALEMAANTQR